jgi:C-terminal processing protease CtpA/Prc
MVVFEVGNHNGINASVGIVSKKLGRAIFESEGKPANLLLTIENNKGEIQSVEMPVDSHNLLYTKDYPYIAKELKEGVWHVNLCYSAGRKHAKYKEFAKFVPQLKNARGIIFDVRGGDGPHFYSDLVLSHLIDTAISVGNLRGSDYYFPNQQHAFYRKTPSSTWYIAPATNQKSIAKSKKSTNKKFKKVRFICPVVFLTDADVISYGESVMEMVKLYRLGTIIGEPTAGTNGDVRRDFGVWRTGIKFTNHDDSQHHAIGVIPDIIVSPEAGHDKVLEFAISYLTK